MPHAACRMRPRARPGVEDAVAMLSPLLTPPQHREDAPQRVAKGECHVAEPCRRATSATDVSHLTKHSDVPKPRVKLPNAHAAHSCETRNEATRTRRVDAKRNHEPRARSTNEAASSAALKRANTECAPSQAAGCSRSHVAAFSLAAPVQSSIEALATIE